MSSAKEVKKKFIKKRMKSSMTKPVWWYLFHPMVYIRIRKDAEEDWSIVYNVAKIGMVLRRLISGKTIESTKVQGSEEIRK